jgi:hypothetical protein
MCTINSTLSAACAHLASMPLSFHTPLRIDEAGGSPNFVRVGDMRRSRICLCFPDNSLLGDVFSQFQKLFACLFIFRGQQQGSQLRSTKMTLSPLRNILLMKRSLLTPRPPALLFSVHISLTFSSTILQWRSKALTRASSLRLLRHEIKTCVCVRVAVWRMDRGPVDSSCASSTPISYSL